MENSSANIFFMKLISISILLIILLAYVKIINALQKINE